MSRTHHIDVNREPGLGVRGGANKPSTGKPFDGTAGGPGISALMGLLEWPRRLLPSPHSNSEGLGVRFQGIAESFVRWGALLDSEPGPEPPPPASDSLSEPGNAPGGTRSPYRPMSSGRLFLDRVARQHCPSPLHRSITKLSRTRRPACSEGTLLLCAKGDISTLLLHVREGRTLF